MWIVLNPQKSHRFTTKGINLHKGAPTAFIDPGLPTEIKAYIDGAISRGEIIKVDGNEIDGMIIPKQAKLEAVNNEDTDHVIKYDYERDDNGRILSTIIKMPDRDGNCVEDTKQNIVVMTGIVHTPIDEIEEA